MKRDKGRRRIRVVSLGATEDDEKRRRRRRDGRGEKKLKMSESTRW